MVITACILDDAKAKRIEKMFVRLGAEIRRWHGEQNTIVRDTHGACDWMLAQASGDLMVHLDATISVLDSPAALKACEFCMEAPTRADSLLALVEDEVAQRFGDLALALVEQRLVRTLWLIGGWPGRFVTFLGAADVATEALREFKEDYLCYHMLRDEPHKSDMMQKFVQRSVFELLPVRQIVLGCQELGWTGEPHNDIKRVIAERC